MKQNDWITQGMKLSRKHIINLYNVMMKNFDSEAKEHYMKYCRILKKVIKKAKNQRNSRLIAKSSKKLNRLGPL
jgi:hypothetical protein